MKQPECCSVTAGITHGFVRPEGLAHALPRLSAVGIMLCEGSLCVAASLPRMLPTHAFVRPEGLAHALPRLCAVGIMLRETA